MACLPKIKTNKYPLLFTFLLLQSNLQGSRVQIYEGTSEFSFLGPHGFCNCQIVRIHNSIKYKQHLVCGCHFDNEAVGKSPLPVSAHLDTSYQTKSTKPNQNYWSKQSTPGSVVPLAMFHLVHSPTWIHRRSNLLCLESMLERWKGQKIIWKHLFLESHLKWWSYCMVSASLLFGNVCVLVLQTFDTIGVFCFPATIWKYICLFCVLVFPIFDWWLAVL